MLVSNATETVIDVTVAGHICLDVIPDLSQNDGAEFQRLFQPGRLVEVGEIAFATGGPVANTGLALHRLGIKTQLMGKVGDDLYGEEIRKLISESDPRLAAGMVVDGDSSTSYTIVINPPGIDRTFLHFAGANASFRAADVRLDRVERSRLFHFGYPPIMRSMYERGGAELSELFRRVKATGVTTALDMSVPDPSSPSGRADWRAILTKTLPDVDIFLPSGEEILFMLRRQQFQEFTAAGDLLEQVTPQLLSDLGAELLDMGAAIVVIKLGRRGFYLRTGDPTRIANMGRALPAQPERWAQKEIWGPAFRVKEVGATGAGDASIAGFHAALLRDMSPEEAVIMATAVGACNVEAADGLSGILPWEATRRRIDDGWLKHALNIDIPGWRFDIESQLWNR